MTQLTIDLPENIREKLKARAAQEGFPSIERYAEALLQASAEIDTEDAGLEQLLAERMGDDRPGIDFTPQWAERFRKELNDRRQASGDRP